MKTTLNKIRDCSPCTLGYKKLLAYLGKTQADDEPLSITTVIDSNGLDDALWCLRAVEGHDREIRLYAVWCARQVQHLMTDPRSIDALNVSERYANGLVTDAELATAWDAARDAAWDAREFAAGEAVWAAALAAARTAARTTAEAAAWASAWVAVRAEVGAAARDAARTAALDAVWAVQESELRRICATIKEQS